MTRVIYLSGPMTGLPDFNRQAFMNTAAALKLHGGAVVVNPVENGVPADAPWHHHMRRDIAMLMECTAIYMLPGWSNSNGAKLERHIAVELGMDVLGADK